MNNNGNKRPGGGYDPNQGRYNSPQNRPAIRRVKRRSFAGPVIAAVIMTVIVIVAIVLLFMLLTDKMDLPFGAEGTKAPGTGTPATGDVTVPDTANKPETTGGDGTSAQTQGSADITGAPETDAPVKTVTGYKTVPVANTAVHTGDLILVNYQNAYTFPDKKNTVTIYGKKNTSYKLSTSQLEVNVKTLDALNAMAADYAKASNNHDMFVRAAYRSLADQQALYDARAKAYGEENAKKYLAQPGSSEHHTGMCFDLGIYTDEGKSYELDGIAGYSDWFLENCVKYGFVQRFPENKADITKVTGETWHFRYVGVAHAETIKKLGLCLEEYIDTLRMHPYDGEHLLVTTSAGEKYEIYYQPASAADSTDVAVPENLTYDISGDNSQGFIVTVKLSA